MVDSAPSLLRRDRHVMRERVPQRLDRGVRRWQAEQDTEQMYYDNRDPYAAERQPGDPGGKHEANDPALREGEQAIGVPRIHDARRCRVRWTEDDMQEETAPRM